MKKLSLNLNEFHNYINDKKILCFGAGKHGRRMLDIMHNYKKLNDLIGFIDNNPEKQGTSFEYEEFSFPIFSIDEALNTINPNTVLIITCIDDARVAKQLENYEKFKNIEYTSLVDISLKQLTCSDYSNIIKQYDKPVIPKKIHYCWFGKGEKPDLVKRNIKKWEKMCPDYEIIEWNESNYDITKNLYIKQAYEKKMWAFVSDYARLDIIYKYGGLYFDTDVDIVKKPDDLLYQDCFATFDCTLMVATGAGFGARPNCEIIKELGDYYDSISFLKPDGTIDDTSCMMHTYAVLKKYGFKSNDTLQNVKGMNIYPMIFQGTCAYLQLMRTTEKTYFNHLHTGTWLSKELHRIREENIKNLALAKESELVIYSIK